MGCGQQEAPVDHELIREKYNIFSRFFRRGHISATDNLKQDIGEKSSAAALPDLSARSTPRTERGVSQASPRIQAYEYVMHGHAEQCVERYLQLAGLTIESLKPVTTPTLDDHQLQPEDFVAQGKLSHIAARVVLKELLPGKSRTT